jgi:hypothetical protein
MAFNLEDYETVEERLIKYWKENPDGRIETELLEATATRFIVVARIFRTEADLRYWTSGLAFEHITERGVNATSALENAETSAIGRALANAGFATKGKRASRSEMSKVAANKFEKRVENFTRETVPVVKPSDEWTIEQKEMPLPVADAVAALNDNVTPEQVPMCKQHNKPMQKNFGSKNGKQWANYKCSGQWPDKCEEIIWLEIDKSGKWVPQRPRVKQGEFN